MISEQEKIAHWFDDVYRQRGFRYLRPPEAYEIFGRLINPKADSRILDVACGPGLLLGILQKYGGELYGIDISQEAIRACEEYCPQANVIVGNAESLPYPDGKFTHITCIGSLERMIDRNTALKEMIRVATSDATFCFMVRNSENLTWKYFQKPLGLQNREGHQDAMNLHSWTKLFEECGFRIENIYPDHWPYHRFMKTIIPWKSGNYGKILKFPFSIEHAYEFIFILKKK